MRNNPCVNSLHHGDDRLRLGEEAVASTQRVVAYHAGPRRGSTTGNDVLANLGVTNGSADGVEDFVLAAPVSIGIAVPEPEVALV